MSVIASFQGKYRWLSNFVPARVEFEGLAFPTVEHAYQATKTYSAVERMEIMKCSSPGQAKRMGQGVLLRADWEDVKHGIMLELLRQKFEAPEMARRLLATGDSILIEGNHWHDCEWGVCMCRSCGGVGENMLGELLMRVRAELKDVS